MSSFWHENSLKNFGRGAAASLPGQTLRRGAQMLGAWNIDATPEEMADTLYRMRHSGNQEQIGVRNAALKMFRQKYFGDENQKEGTGQAVLTDEGAGILRGIFQEDNELYRQLTETRTINDAKKRAEEEGGNVDDYLQNAAAARGLGDFAAWSVAIPGAGGAVGRTAYLGGKALSAAAGGGKILGAPGRAVSAVGKGLEKLNPLEFNKHNKGLKKGGGLVVGVDGGISGAATYHAATSDLTGQTPHQKLRSGEENFSDASFALGAGAFGVGIAPGLYKTGKNALGKGWHWTKKGLGVEDADVSQLNTKVQEFLNKANISSDDAAEMVRRAKAIADNSPEGERAGMAFLNTKALDALSGTLTSKQDTAKWREGVGRALQTLYKASWNSAQKTTLPGGKPSAGVDAENIKAAAKRVEKEFQRRYNEVFSKKRNIDGKGKEVELDFGDLDFVGKLNLPVKTGAVQRIEKAMAKAAEGGKFSIKQAHEFKSDLLRIKRSLPRGSEDASRIITHHVSGIDGKITAALKTTQGGDDAVQAYRVLNKAYRDKVGTNIRSNNIVERIRKARGESPEVLNSMILRALTSKNSGADIEKMDALLGRKFVDGFVGEMMRERNWKVGAEIVDMVRDGKGGALLSKMSPANKKFLGGDVRRKIIKDVVDGGGNSTRFEMVRDILGQLSSNKHAVDLFGADAVNEWKALRNAMKDIGKAPLAIENLSMLEKAIQKSLKSGEGASSYAITRGIAWENSNIDPATLPKMIGALTIRNFAITGLENLIRAKKGKPVMDALDYVAREPGLVGKLLHQKLTPDEADEIKDFILANPPTTRFGIISAGAGALSQEDGNSTFNKQKDRLFDEYFPSK